METAAKVLGVIIVIVIILIAIRMKYKQSRCTNCKKKNTISEYNREAIKRSKRSQDLGNGRRYYYLVTYKVTYKCENCGTTFEKGVSREGDE